MRKNFFLGLIFTLFCWSSTAWAVESPADLIDRVSQQVIQELKSQKTDLRSNQRLTYQIIRRVILPHFDIPAMSQSVLARHWREISPAQRARFKTEFTRLLLRTYAHALAEYNDEHVKVLPLPRRLYQGRQRVKVKSLIIRRGAPSIVVEYQMKLKGNQWLVRDFIVEHVSLIANFRSQFSSQLRSGSMDDLLNKLGDLNREAQ